MHGCGRGAGGPQGERNGNYRHGLHTKQAKAAAVSVRKPHGFSQPRTRWRSGSDAVSGPWAPGQSAAPQGPQQGPRPIDADPSGGVADSLDEAKAAFRAVVGAAHSTVSQSGAGCRQRPLSSEKADEKCSG
jgi:hypothetical protein